MNTLVIDASSAISSPLRAVQRFRRARPSSATAASSRETPRCSRRALRDDAAAASVRSARRARFGRSVAEQDLGFAIEERDALILVGVDDRVVGDREDARRHQVGVLDVLVFTLLGGDVAHRDQVIRTGVTLRDPHRQAQLRSAARASGQGQVAQLR